MEQNKIKSPPFLASLFSAAFLLIGTLFICTLGIFFLNIGQASDQPISGSRSFLRAVGSENAKETKVAYALNDTYALIVDERMISAVRYVPSLYPCAFACGKYMMAGDSVNFPIEVGDYFVAQYPNLDGTYRALQRSTNTYFPNATPESIPEINTSLSLTPLTAEKIFSAGYPSLSLQKESCLVITFTELLLLGICALGFGAAKILSKRASLQKN